MKAREDEKADYTVDLWIDGTWILFDTPFFAGGLGWDDDTLPAADVQAFHEKLDLQCKYFKKIFKDTFVLK